MSEFSLTPYSLTESPLTGGVTQDLVTDKFAQAQAYADTAFNLALNSMAQVGDYEIDPDLDEPDPISVNEFGLSGLNPVVPTEPTINPVSVTIATFTEDSPTLKPLTSQDISAPPLNFNWQTDEYDDELQRALKIKIIYGLLNGTGIQPEVEQAYYDREVYRINVDADLERTKITEEFSSGGARIAQGVLMGRLDSERVRREQRLDNAARDAMIRASEIELDFIKHIIAQGVALENELINLFGGMQGRNLDAAKFTVSNLIEEFRIRVESNTAQLNADVEYNKLLMTEFTAKLELFKAQLQANETDAEVQAKVEGLKIQQLESNVKKFTAIVEAITESYKAEISVGVANSDVAIRYQDLLTRIKTAQAQINAELIKAKSLVAAQLASSALGSVSAGANLGYSQQRSDSQSQTKTRSQQESVSLVFTERNCCNNG